MSLKGAGRGKDVRLAGSAIKPTPGKAAPASNGNDAKKPSLTVMTTSKKDEIGVQTLVGDFEEAGLNHGRKYYKKVQAIAGHADVKVFLYYWDMRDGADFAGWWFGDELGGSQVWARCSSHGNVPPVAGWKIPWDAMKSEPGLLTVHPYKGTDAASNGEKAADPKPAVSGLKPAAPALKPAVAGLKPTLTPGQSALKPAIPAASTALKPTPPAGKPTVLAAGKPLVPAAGKPAVPAASSEGMDEAVAATKAEVEAMENAAKDVVTKSKAVTQDTDADVLTELRESLTEQQKSLMESQKAITQQISEARKTGPSAISSVTEFTKLATRLRTVAASVTTELNRMKAFISNVAKREETAKKTAASQAQQKEMEEKHQKELEETLPELQDAVTTAEDAVEAVGIMASPIIAEPPDDEGDSLTKILDEIETTAAEAQTRLTECRQQLNTKLNAARTWAPEARKTAIAEFTSLQGKLNDAQKKLKPYQNMKKEFSQRVEAKKALKDIFEQLSNAELEVEKAAMMSTGAETGGQMSEEDVKSAEELVAPAQKALLEVSRLIEVKLRAADGPMKDELTSMKEQLAESKATVDKVSVVLKSQREGLTLQSVYTAAQEKVDKAEESLAKCGEAELIFLKGVEVLPQGESEKAIKESETAAAESTALLLAAQNFLKQKMLEIKKYSKDTVVKANQELMELQKRAGEIGKKLASFKSETEDRKVTALMAEALDAVVKAENKASLLTEVGAVFSSDNLDGTSVDALKDAAVKTAAADKDCTTAITGAKKVLAEKLRSAKDKELVNGLTKLQTRMNAAQQEITKVKKAASLGDKLVKTKEVASDAEAKLELIEAEVDKLVRMSRPDEEGLGVERITDETILQMDVLTADAIKKVKPVLTLVSTNLATAPPVLKAALTKLSDRCKAAQTKVDEVKSGTKEQRERVLAESYVREGEVKTKEVEALLEQMDEAEAPYLKGMELLAEEAVAILSACDAAAAKVQTSISDTRTLIASKNLEIKKFEAKNAKSSLEGFTKLTERVNSAATKLGVFKRDTEKRRKKAQLQEASAKVTEVEKEVEKVSAAMKTVTERDADELSSSEAASMIQEVEQLEQSAQSKVTACRDILAVQSRDAKDDADKASQIKSLTSKMTAATTELAKAKKLGAAHIDKIKAKGLIQEAADKVKEVETELEKANSACAPLTEEKGERFLVKTSVRTLATALLAHMADKSISEEDMCNMMGSPLNQTSFVEFVGKIPESLQREECFFTEERREAMFKAIDTDGDGVVSVGEFKVMLFSNRCECVHNVSMTDVFDIATSKAICKLEIGNLLEVQGAPKSAEADSPPRLKCKLLSSGQEGWVTMQGNGGTKYLEPASAFKEFSSELNAALETATKNISSVSTSVVSRQRELAAAGADSPLKVAKDDIARARSKLQSHSLCLDALKKRVEESKKEYVKTEKKEKNAYIEAKEKKEAEAFLAGASSSIEALAAELRKLEDASKPLVERHGTDLVHAFETPLTLLNEVKGLERGVRAAAQEAKTTVKTQQDLVAKAEKGPMLSAKKELGKWWQDIGKTETSCRKVVTAIRRCCDSIVDAKFQQVASALRSDIKGKEMSFEDAFKKLAGDADKIPEDTFCSHIRDLEGVELPIEHAKLLASRIETEGISCRSFLRFVQQYFKVVTGIAITPVFDIVNSKDRPVRKAEVDEIVEIVEGPKTCEKSGLARVNVKALQDGAEGWITVKGNHGKVFLEEAQKPFLTCLKETDLDKDFQRGAEEPIRKLKIDEVVEVIEGPRKETLGTVMRLRGKAVKDGKAGWVTVKDKYGNEFAEKGTKVYVCTASVAITDDFDIQNCKVIKKLAVDEVFTISEGPVKEESSGISRIKGRSNKDGTEGWVTVCGNAGTVYAKLNEKLYTVKREVTLTKQFNSDSPEIRNLAVSEAFEALEGPKEEKTIPLERAKVRTSTDGVVGWITVKSDSVAKWSTSYKFLKAGPLYAGKGLKESTVREASSGEVIELLEGPVELEGVMWIKCSLNKDGSVGWTPMKDESGERLLSQ